MQRVQTYYGQTTRLKLDRDSVITRQTLRVAKWHLYGSSRLGIYKTQDTLRKVDLSLVYKLSDVNIAPTQTLSKKEFYSFDSTYTHKCGDQLYEGSNHLGNVLVTFTDKRLATCTEGQVHYQADVRSATDYAAFGALLDDRQWYSGLDSGEYRYGFNSVEMDNELLGVGNTLSFRYKVHNARLGRFFSIDPLEIDYPWNSPYAFAENRVIDGFDLEGLEHVNYNARTADGVVFELYVSSRESTAPAQITSTFENNTIDIFGNNATNTLSSQMPGINPRIQNVIGSATPIQQNTINIIATSPNSGDIGYRVTVANQFNDMYTNVPIAGGTNPANPPGDFGTQTTREINNGSFTTGAGPQLIVAGNIRRVLYVTNGTPAANANAQLVVGSPANPSTGAPATGLMALHPNVQFCIMQDNGRGLNNDQTIVVNNPTQDFINANIITPTSVVIQPWSNGRGVGAAPLPTPPLTPATMPNLLTNMPD